MRHHRARFLAAYGALTGVALAAVLAFAAVTAMPHPARCPTIAAKKDPIATAVAFLDNAVAAKDARGAYGLVTAPLDNGLSCAQWAAAPPVQRHAVDWTTARYEVAAQGTGQLVLTVTLAPKTQFLLELRQRGDRWLVGSWDRV
jgi:hypothetical protein